MYDGIPNILIRKIENKIILYTTRTMLNDFAFISQVDTDIKYAV